MLWYSKSRRSSELKSMPLFAGLAVTISRATACCLTTAKQMRAAHFKVRYLLQLFLKAVLPAEKELYTKSYGKTGLLITARKRVI